MPEIVITPSGRDALQASLLVDDAGHRFVVLTFEEPGRDRVCVTFTIDPFRQYSAHLERTAAITHHEQAWKNAARK